MLQICECPVETAVSMIGGKWKIIIIQKLLSSGSMRFGELRREVNGISAKVLTDQLNELIADQLVEKTIFAEVPLHTEYKLTPVGESLREVLSSLRNWGGEFKRRIEAGELPQYERKGA